MKFGKVEDIGGIDFRLPQDDIQNKQRISHPSKKTSLYVGGTGWSMTEWKGIIYPDNAKVSEFLSYYGKHFNSIELNSTHYRIPKHEILVKWKESVPSDFRFCPKVWQNISHRKNLGIGDDTIPRFVAAMELFEAKLGPTFMQLPPYFSFDRLNQLATSLDLFPKGFKIAVEARHPSFFLPEKLPYFLELLHRKEALFVITDVAGRRDMAQSSLTASAAFVRWVGHGNESTDYSRLTDWTKRLRHWQKLGLPEIYFFPHQPDNLRTPEISSYFCSLLESKTTIKVRGPKLLAQQRQLKLFE